MLQRNSKTKSRGSKTTSRPPPLSSGSWIWMPDTWKVFFPKSSTYPAIFVKSKWCQTFHNDLFFKICCRNWSTWCIMIYHHDHYEKCRSLTGKRGVFPHLQDCLLWVKSLVPWGTKMAGDAGRHIAICYHMFIWFTWINECSIIGFYPPLYLKSYPIMQDGPSPLDFKL